MSDDLVKRLRTEPNWMREDYPQSEAADRIETQAARIAALEAAVTQCRTLSAMLKPQADRIAELEAALGDLLRCTEKHVFGDECKAQREKARAALEGGK